MAQKPEVNVVVEDRYSLRSIGKFRVAANSLRIRLDGANYNVLHGQEYIEQAVGHSPSSLALDLYKIALVVFISDLQTLRTSTSNMRDFRILVPVSNLDKWVNAKPLLEAMLDHLSFDNFEFHFIQGKRAPTPQYALGETGQVVSLFSGGLDSLAGVRWALDQGYRPRLVSHYSSSAVCNTQADLVNQISRIVPNIHHYQIRAKGRDGTALGEQRENSQLSRSFLYLSLATLFALELGISRVFMFENGVIALNIPLTPSRTYLSTRTAHPHFVQNYNQLLAWLFETNISVETPFVNSTKGEVAVLLDDDRFRDLVRLSCSCWSRGRLHWAGVPVAQVKHCGYCYPCAIRRVAVDHANLWDYDGPYSKDIFGEFDAIPIEGRQLVLELLAFARNLRACQTDDDAIGEYPAFFANENLDPGPLVEMYRRHVQQVRDCFARRASPSLRQRIGGYL